MWATAVPVASAIASTNRVRTFLSGTPRLSAVDSPRLKASNTKLRPHERPAQNISTPNISQQDDHPTNAVEPNKKPCMFCSASGRMNINIDVAAPITTPTIIPANSNRIVCCTPRASSNVNKTAPTAPTKAAPVSPICTRISAAIRLPPKNTNANPTPNAAPDALPNK